MEAKEIQQILNKNSISYNIYEFLKKLLLKGQKDYSKLNYNLEKKLEELDQ